MTPPAELAIPLKVVGLVMKALKALEAKNDEALRYERTELALQWGAELKQAIPAVVAYLEGRVADVELRIASSFDDAQLPRVYQNFAYEAAREAIDERRLMLAHAAAGILDPDMDVERKARVERTLRLLDPLDVRTLKAISQLHGHDQRSNRAELLFKAPSGDALVAGGCIRIETVGGGFGTSAGTGASLTQAGRDVIAVLRSYLATRPPPLTVPGREIAPSDRSEDDARGVLATITGLVDFVHWTCRRSNNIHRTYRPPRSTQPLASLKFYIHDWSAWEPKLQALGERCRPIGIVVSLPKQLYTPHEGNPYDLLRVEMDGPHDLLRWVADDCDAYWEH